VSADILGWVVWGLLAALTLAGAFGVLLARETMRLVVSLGAFLLGVAGLYLYHAMALLAAAQVFLYVGGVLVLFLFAIMALRREAGAGAAVLQRRFEPMAAATSLGFFLIMAGALRELGGSVALRPLAAAGTEATGDLLLSRFLPQFEIVGVLLLVALVVAIAISSGGEER
jgi:NADH-quinone oxidoreductase subunit J